MSTVALATHADAVVGVDAVARDAAAPRAPADRRELLARQRGTAAVRPRSLRRRDVFFGRALVRSRRGSSPNCAGCCGRTAGSGSTTTTSSTWRTSTGSATWTRELFARYPLPPRNPQVGDPRADTPAGFEEIASEFFDDPIAMTPDEFADYQLTVSHCVAAVERGAPQCRGSRVGHGVDQSRSSPANRRAR